MKTVALRSYQLGRLGIFLGTKDLVRLYKSFVLPVLDYGDILYSKSNNDLLEKLQRSQNKTLKLI